jgi:hypothetical protein
MLGEDLSHFAGDVDPHQVFSVAAEVDDKDGPMGRVIEQVEHHKYDTAAADGFERDRCRMPCGTAEGGGERFLRGRGVCA